MKAKIREQKIAVRLRKQGWGIGEIASKLKVAKSSVSLWCKEIKLEESQLKRLENKRPAINYGAIAIKTKRQLEIKKIRQSTLDQCERFDQNNLRRLDDIGIVLYWAEGSKRGARSVDFTNSDPMAIKIIMLWLRKIHKVPETKFRVSIYYHGNQNELSLKNFWSAVTKVPLEQFHKSIYKKEGTGHRKNILTNGTCKIRVCNANLLHKILASIEQFYIN